MTMNGLVVDVAWPELPRGIAGPDELADQLDASLRDRAGITSIDRHGLAVRVYHPQEVEALAADLADTLSIIGMSDHTYLSWRDDLGVHRRSVTGRRMATTGRRVA